MRPQGVATSRGVPPGHTETRREKETRDQDLGVRGRPLARGRDFLGAFPRERPTTLKSSTSTSRTRMTRGQRFEAKAIIWPLAAPLTIIDLDEVDLSGPYARLSRISSPRTRPSSRSRGGAYEGTRGEAVAQVNDLVSGRQVKARPCGGLGSLRRLH